MERLLLLVKLRSRETVAYAQTHMICRSISKWFISECAHQNERPYSHRPDATTTKIVEGDHTAGQSHRSRSIIRVGHKHLGPLAPSCLPCLAISLALQLLCQVSVIKCMHVVLRDMLHQFITYKYIYNRFAPHIEASSP